MRVTSNVTRNQLITLRGKPVFSSDGEKVGKVDEIFFDPGSTEAEWLGIGTGFLGMKHILVPVAGANIDERDGDEAVVVPYAKQTIQDAPDIDADEGITMEQERQLCSYYGMQTFDPQAHEAGARLYTWE